MYDDFISSRLSQLRVQKGFSARDMSLSIGQCDSYVNKIENKRSQPSMNAFFAICEHLGVTPKDFFDEENKYPERLNGIIEKIKKLDEKSISYIDEIVTNALKIQNKI